MEKPLLDNNVYSQPFAKLVLKANINFELYLFKHLVCTFIKLCIWKIKVDPKQCQPYTVLSNLYKQAASICHLACWLWLKCHQCDVQWNTFIKDLLNKRHQFFKTIVSSCSNTLQVYCKITLTFELRTPHTKNNCRYPSSGHYCEVPLLDTWFWRYYISKPWNLQEVKKFFDKNDLCT